MPVKKYVLGLTLFIAFQPVTSAQTTAARQEENLQNLNVILVDPNGSAFLPNKYSTVTNGSAFLTDEFRPATIFFAGNKAARTEQLRLDLLENNVHFLNAAKEELIVSQPVLKIIFETAGGGKEIFVHGSTLPTDNTAYKKSWFQIITDGEPVIYKRYFKTIFEYKPFNAGVIEKTIETYEKYFIIKDAQLVESKKARPKK
jgi:hypothetical protein